MSRKTLSKIWILVLHISGWILILIVPFRFLGPTPFFIRDRVGFKPPPAGPRPAPMDIDPILFQIESLVTTLLLAAFFYLNFYLLVPKILSRKGWLPYIGCLLVALIIYLGTSYLTRTLVFPSHQFFPPRILTGMPIFFMIIALSLAMRLIQDRSSIEKTLKDQENERLKSELVFLRSQVSPHFIFNVLNSLASLARKKSDKVEEAIIQLSHLMRYTLYTENKVTIEREVEYLNNYINLQRLRFGTSAAINFNVDIERMNLLIEPMLLIPFVENAFKHGIGLIQDPVIDITLKANYQEINFIVRNKFNPAQNESKDSASGIGLQNVKRRLDLLYKNLHQLKIETIDGNWYVTELNLIAS